MAKAAEFENKSYFLKLFRCVPVAVCSTSKNISNRMSTTNSKEYSMKKHLKTTALMAALVSGALTTGIAQAGMNQEAQVWADDQAVSEGTVTAKKVTAGANGWLVVRRRTETLKSGPVAGHGSLQTGERLDVSALLT